MKKTALCFAVMIAMAAPTYAQFGSIGKIKDRVNQAKKIADIKISEQDERAIGEAVSEKLIERFGIYQDPEVAKYVSLVGLVLAELSDRPQLEWKFIVLDTDGVNAYAAPGGIVHITRGALGLMKSEAELAGVLGHELTHVTAKHTIRAIQKNKGFQVAAEEVSAQGGLATSLVSRLAQVSYDHVFENKFDRDDEVESDKVGAQLAHKAGYAPSGMSAFLTHLIERNKGQEAKNGLFASHPDSKTRLDEIAKLVKKDKLTSTAMGEARFAGTVKLEATPVTAISMAPIEGVRGAVGGSGAKEEAKEAKKEEPKKRGFGLGGLGGALTQGKQAESTQASASAGGRMAAPDTDAVGGTNRTPVRVTLTPAEIAEFKKGIA